GLGINEGKAGFLEAAEGISSGFTGIFMVLGLFSIAAGILLIVLIFTMLAAERRPEMGMARAVGQRRLQLIQQFISEGAAYAILAGVVGIVIGIGAIYVLAAALGSLFGDSFPMHANISPRSLISAYALGVTITFVTVVAASVKISRLNIVAAVRDIPDEHRAKRSWKTLLWATLLLLAGGGMLLGGISSGSAFPFYCGISLAPFGIALFMVWFGVPGRIAFSVVGLWLLGVWLLPDSLFNRIFGDYDGGIEMFFLSGIFLVIGSTILIVQNTNTLLWLVTKIGSLFKHQLGAIKLAVAYPGNARGRTGMAIAMFSLIIFSLVMIATISQNLTAAFLSDDALAGWNVTAQTNAGQPIDNFQDRIASANIPAGDIVKVGQLQQNNGVAVSMQETGPIGGPPGSYILYMMDSTFLDTTNWKFSYRANGFDSDQAVVDALRTNSTYVVVDELAAFGNDFGPPSSLELPGFKAQGTTFAPVTLQVANADGNGTTEVTVIGLIDPSRQFLFGMYGTAPGLAPVIGDSPTETYFIKTAKGADSVQVAGAIQATLIRDGIKVTSIQKSLEDAQRISSGFLYMIQGFMGLGLIVGLAAVGVISFRSVVERRQQIGMMRALGFQK
ncbi:MAG TPA: FtsX-like permease family protein, partial [Thermomicrobiales bacterium]|nr:FtsX-like permease family protein [Thermomicrobiales bacterium]